MSLKILLLKGLPASGKSTYATELLEKELGSWKRVNKDSFRIMLDNYHYDRDNESFIQTLQNRTITAILNRGINVIVDNTNLSSKTWKDMCQIAQNVGDVIVEEKNFEIDIEECVRRDACRDGHTHVGEDVIRNFYKRYGMKRGLPKEKRMYFAKGCMIESVVGEQDDTLEQVLICDLDGTVSLFNKDFGERKIELVKGAHFRNPYDASTCDNDTLNEAVASVLKAMSVSGCKIIFMSGREDQYKEQTLTFLNKHFDFKFDLFMRKTEDKRKDSIVKEEMFNENIRGKYFVMFVLDDRKQVIHLWRDKLCLPCFQVAWGDF